jgi:hypothetical protein
VGWTRIHGTGVLFALVAEVVLAFGLMMGAASLAVGDVTVTVRAARGMPLHTLNLSISWLTSRRLASDEGALVPPRPALLYWKVIYVI